MIIVAQPATYQATNTFTDPAGNKYSMETPWEVKTRSELYVTGSTETEWAIAELREEVEHADESADGAQEAIEALEARDASLEASVDVLQPRTSGTTLNHAGGWTSPVAVGGLIASVVALASAGYAVARANNKR